MLESSSAKASRGIVFWFSHPEADILMADLAYHRASTIADLPDAFAPRIAATG